MTDWIKASLDAQQTMLEAQRQALNIGTDGVGGEALAKAREASSRAVEANLAAWQAWTRLWGVGPW